jgi:hypothetical protein
MNTDGLFALVAMAAVACFAALLTLQFMEFKYYEDPLTPPARVNIWK